MGYMCMRTDFQVTEWLSLLELLHVYHKPPNQGNHFRPRTDLKTTFRPFLNDHDILPAYSPPLNHPVWFNGGKKNSGKNKGRKDKIYNPQDIYQQAQFSFVLEKVVQSFNEHHPEEGLASARALGLLCDSQTDRCGSHQNISCLTPLEGL